MNIDLFVEIASWFCFSLGGFILVVGALGFLRMPDFWSRIHTAGMIDTLGSALILLGMMLQGGFSLITFKLVMIGFFIFIAGPTATHAIANAAWVAGLMPKDIKKDDSALIGRKKAS
tara:strand:+ start:54569 stop:54919 length:351 start_codon:yes stop_codon:yes gene_type:complete